MSQFVNISQATSKKAVIDIREYNAISSFLTCSYLLMYRSSYGSVLVLFDMNGMNKLIERRELSSLCVCSIYYIGRPHLHLLRKLPFYLCATHFTLITRPISLYHTFLVFNICLTRVLFALEATSQPVTPNLLQILQQLRHLLNLNVEKKFDWHFTPL
jgi:hypothetical protein